MKGTVRVKRFFTGLWQAFPRKLPEKSKRAETDESFAVSASKTVATLFWSKEGGCPVKGDTE